VTAKVEKINSFCRTTYVLIYYPTRRKHEAHLTPRNLHHVCLKLDTAEQYMSGNLRRVWNNGGAQVRGATEQEEQSALHCRESAYVNDLTRARHIRHAPYPFPPCTALCLPLLCLVCTTTEILYTDLPAHCPLPQALPRLGTNCGCFAIN
jgi:hypothetical protein